jgi:putative colanic acid biosynthesis acetyltransferase WcaF
MRFQNLKDFKLPAGFRGKPAWFVQLWWLVQTLLFKPSPQFMYGWRRFLLRCFGAKIGHKVMIRPSAHIQFPWRLKIGDYSWIGDEVVLYNLGLIIIGEHSVVSQRSYLCTGSHHHLTEEFSIYTKPIIIENECWLAADVFVAPGVHIGEGTIVGSRSSVFKSLPMAKVCFGNPATVIKDRAPEDVESLINLTLIPAAIQKKSVELWADYFGSTVMSSDL